MQIRSEGQNRASLIEIMTEWEHGVISRGRGQGKQHHNLRTKALMQGMGTIPDCRLG